MINLLLRVFQPSYLVEIHGKKSGGEILRPLFKRVSGWYLPRVGECYLIPDGILYATVTEVRHNRYGKGNVVVEVSCSVEYEYNCFKKAGWSERLAAA